MAETKKILDEIAAERCRQVDARFTHDRDDTLPRGELARAGAAYAFMASLSDLPRSVSQDLSLLRSPFASHQILSFLWPWEISAWKPKNRRADLIRGAALLVAEIERLDRAQENEGGHD